jgi:hypothetical protein
VASSTSPAIHPTIYPLGIPEDLAPWAQHVEETYIAQTLGRPAPAPLVVPTAAGELDRDALEAIAAAAACAVAARFLAVGKPRSLGILADDPRRALALLAGHRVWHQPTDIRCAGAAATVAALAARGGRAVSTAEVLTADIVCVDVEMVVENRLVRRGSHLNLIASGVEAEAELWERALCYGETMKGAPAKTATLGDLAAGLCDGRQLDEITLLFAGPMHGGGGDVHGLRLARAACGLIV